jgi:hypothetical protein
MDGWRDWVLLGGFERVSSCRDKSVDSLSYGLNYLVYTWSSRTKVVSLTRTKKG